MRKAWNSDILLAKMHADLARPAKTQLRALIAFPVTPRCSPSFPSLSGTQRVRHSSSLDNGRRIPCNGVPRLVQARV